MKTKPVLAAITMLAVAGALAACTAGGGDGDGGGGDASNCSNEIKNPDAPVVTLWAWYPNSEAVVDNFNEENDDVQVCWTNVGAGGDAYDKFQTAISGGSGAPDVMMVEADRIAVFQAQDAIIDLSDLGYEDVKDNFGEGAWKDVSVGDGIYGAPIDGGPMGMIYRTDIFEQYGITPPTTWEEFEATAQTVKDAGGPVFASFAANQPAAVTAYMYQNGAEPFEYDPANEGEIGINLNSPEIKEVLDYWAGLVQKDLVGTEDQFTPEYIAGVIGGDYATYLSAAWAPGYLQGAGVGEGADAGVWAAAPLPQWDPANPIAINWGGSAFSVSSQADDPELAAKVAFGVYADQASLDEGWQNQIIFPLNVNVLDSPEFQDYEVPFFSGQQANKEVYVPAANAYKGMTYTPLGQFYYQTLTEQIQNINDGSATGSEAADALQEAVVAYAEEQGFTVK
ncbi:extracellular solute-binding protein [Microbacterium trichothecenolyticum]|uniref:Extracellular solute-binding protein n=1 Tax=Microbacterium ureisolvens TaxID=2781186 RepID=A0ABS7HWZ7_9MICO|nr:MULTISPECIES: extracellular solute-binding protein [Microbacterium]MBW9109141.1 extracellular solute-binding protein [Microbacterium ureisolvens]MBW9119728.1 extracellular solute-binding protein [Microbacterium trichothecenolyticum]